MRLLTLSIVTCRASLPLYRSFHRSSAGIPEQTAEIVPLPEVRSFSVHNWFWFRTARPERIVRLLLVATALPHVRIPGSQAIIGKVACAALGKMSVPFSFSRYPGLACASITRSRSAARGAHKIPTAHGHVRAARRLQRLVSRTDLYFNRGCLVSHRSTFLRS